jgi:hypothetical protein
MMLTVPGFREAKAIDVLDQLQITLNLQRRILANRMNRRNERSETHRNYSSVMRDKKKALHCE